MNEEVFYQIKKLLLEFTTTKLNGIYFLNCF